MEGERNRAKEYALNEINRLIELHGENHIYCRAPQPGKNSWTLGEIKDSIEGDYVPEGLTENVIDETLRLHVYLVERGKTGLW